MFPNARNCSVHDLLFLKPPCSSLSRLFTSALSLFRITILNTFPGIDSSVIPHQFPQSLRFPFFGNLMMMPWRQSSGTYSSVQMLLKRLLSSWKTTSLPCFNISVVMPSTPGSLLFFSIFIAILTSPSPIRFIAMSIHGAG